MNKAWAAKKGFTIIELLVSIVVIGILVTIMIVSYNGVQQRSRDSQRGSHMTLLNIAIEKYHAEKGQYPDACGNDTECPISTLATQLLPFLSTIPHDPRYTADSYSDYRYVKGAVDPSSATAVDSYAIKVSYEAKAVCKTGQNINSVWWGATIPSC